MFPHCIFNTSFYETKEVKFWTGYFFESFYLLKSYYFQILQERLDGLQGSYEQATIDKDSQNSQTVNMRHSLAAATSFTEALQHREQTWSRELDAIPLVKV